MLVVSEIRAELQRRAQELIPERYGSLDELLNVALENQLNLERQASTGGLTAPAERETGQEDVSASNGNNGSWAELRALAEAEISASAAPGAKDWETPILWGQVNRLLPVNAGVRVLGHMLADAGTDRVPLARWHDQAAEVASSFHHQLIVLDRQAGRKRGDLWATGFPRGDRGSTRRYAGQFLGRGNPRGPGAAEMLGLVSIKKAGAAMTVAITDVGVGWTSQRNPVFDGTSPTETFSVVEVGAYLEILDKQLPEERRFMATVAELIEATESRSDLEAGLADRYPE